MNDKATSVIVVGAGLVGTVLACALSKLFGFDILVLEQRQDPRVQGAGGGRSINLAVSERARSLLRMLGLEEAVRETAQAILGTAETRESESRIDVRCNAF